MHARACMCACVCECMCICVVLLRGAGHESATPPTMEVVVGGVLQQPAVEVGPCQVVHGVLHARDCARHNLRIQVVCQLHGRVSVGMGVRSCISHQLPSSAADPCHHLYTTHRHHKYRTHIRTHTNKPSAPFIHAHTHRHTHLTDMQAHT